MMTMKSISLLIGIALSLSACAEEHYERIIVLDPGHGGVDPGAIGSTSNLLEKEVALRMGLALRDRLEATGRYRVVMTRDDDRFVPLRDRLQLARQGKGELFISLHADNLVSTPEVSGASVYTLAEPTAGPEPPRLASDENGLDLQAGAELSSGADIAPAMLVDLPQRHGYHESATLAALLVQELDGATRLAKRQPVPAGFIVLQSPDMPSVLVELGYLSNPADQQALADDAHIARLATAMVRAVDLYFGVGSS